MLGLNARLGLTIPIRLSDQFFLHPTAGANAVAALGGGSGGAAYGLNFGIATTVFGKGSSAGFRAGATLHQFADLNGPIWLLEVGFVQRR